jgi:hypothetical protein
MSDPACRHFRDLLGVYVVGAIEPQERSALDAHLNQCYACREELAGLAVLPALLRRIPPAEAEQIAGHAGSGELDDPAPDPAPEVLAGLLAEVSARRRTRRLRVVLAAAAAIIVAIGGGSAVATSLDHQSRGTTSAFEMASAHRGNLEVTVRYDGSRWGTAMWVRVHGVPEWTQCKFWVTTSGGNSALAGGWLVGPGGNGLWYPAQAGIQAASVTGFVLTSAGKVLLRIPAD